MKRLFLICLSILLAKLLFAGEGWGYVAVLEADALDKSGMVAATLNGGERFLVKKEVKVEGEKAFYVTMPDRKKAPSYVLWARDCFVSYDALPNKKTDPAGYTAEMAKRKKVGQYYAKYATRERLRQRALENHQKTSPHVALKREQEKLNQIRSAIQSLDARIEKNTAARKKATGAAHIRLVEEGRELRAEQGQLPAQYKGQKSKVEALKETAAQWDATHPFDASKVTQTAMWRKMTAELERLTEELEAAGVELVNGVSPAL